MNKRDKIRLIQAFLSSRKSASAIPGQLPVEAAPKQSPWGSALGDLKSVWQRLFAAPAQAFDAQRGQTGRANEVPRQNKPVAVPPVAQTQKGNKPVGKTKTES